MIVLSIDPGPSQSAYLTLDSSGKPTEFAKIPNHKLGSILRRRLITAEVLAIEMVESFGMAVGKEVFETAFWAGRFVEAWGEEWEAVYRKNVKLHLCRSMRAKDTNIRQALIDKFGGASAIGRKASPGPLYGISGDCWSALAIAVTFAETVESLVLAGAQEKTA